MMMEKTSKTLQHTNKTINTALYQQKALHFIFLYVLSNWFKIQHF